MANIDQRLATGAAVVLVFGLGACSATSSNSPSAQPTQSGPTPSTSRATSPNGSPPVHSPATRQSPTRAPVTEFRPPGDIPDNQVFVVYRVPKSTVQVKVPEGWARSSAGGTTTFTDSINSVSIQVRPSPQAPTVSSAGAVDIPQIKQSVAKFSPGRISLVQLSGGRAILLTYQEDSAANPVTGKVVRDAVERFLFWRAGQEAVLTLTGPTNADNVDPWRIVSDSLRWR